MPPGKGGRAVITPSCHAKPLHTYPSGPKKKAEQLQASPNGFCSAVSAMPAISPLVLWFGQETLLLGPPRVPRSIGTPTHSTACTVVLLARLSPPEIHPRSLIPTGSGTPSNGAVPRLNT